MSDNVRTVKWAEVAELQVGTVFGDRSLGVDFISIAPALLIEHVEPTKELVKHG